MILVSDKFNSCINWNLYSCLQVKTNKVNRILFNLCFGDDTKKEWAIVSNEWPAANIHCLQPWPVDVEDNSNAPLKHLLYLCRIHHHPFPPFWFLFILPSFPLKISSFGCHGSIAYLWAYSCVIHKLPSYLEQTNSSAKPDYIHIIYIYIYVGDWMGWMEKNCSETILSDSHE